MGRVAQECRSARIISFPAASPPPVRHARAGTRWVAAAVAAGVILGIVGEHVTDRITRTAVSDAQLPGAGSAGGRRSRCAR